VSYGTLPLVVALLPLPLPLLLPLVLDEDQQYHRLEVGQVQGSQKRQIQIQKSHG
jgi:hypothetical protein